MSDCSDTEGERMARLIHIFIRKSPLVCNLVFEADFGL